MTRNILSSALLLIVAIISGCTSSGQRVDAKPGTESKPPVRTQPVYVLPNCQRIGTESVCNWIDPTPKGGDGSPQKVDGIAL